MATEGDTQEERDRMDDDPVDSREGLHDLEAERQASTSTERPSNVARSTEDLTIGGNTKQPQGADQGRAERRSSSGQAIENQERALETGEEAPA